MNGAQKLDGKLASSTLLNKISIWSKNWNQKAHLKILQVGENKASSSYIRQKQKAAHAGELQFTHEQLSKNISLSELKKIIDTNNNDPQITAFMLQLPLDSTQAFQNEGASCSGPRQEQQR
jgi:5,10-methylene-tetrahydrofolate dehydrogenase/methenyl tetrahydrofolate cyclohydrolase